jgi:shikimate kinase
MPTITLIGYRGTGKSTVATELARRLECAWWDADLELERDLGTTIGQLVRERGEEMFRDEEARILARLLAEPAGIVATGGGAILRPANRSLLLAQGGLVVWLTAPVEVVRRRLSADPMTPIRRPALSGTDPLSEIEAALSFREPLYRECAQLTVDTSAASPALIAAEILRALEAGGRASTEPS